MDITRRLHLILFIISTLFLILARFAATNLTQWVNTLPSYEDNIMYVMAVDREGDVFVGGNNVVVHLSPNLELKQRVATGNVMDHARCLHPSIPCDRYRVLTENDMYAVHLVYHLESRPLLLVCGTAYRRLCQIRPVGNLEENHWVHPFNLSRGYSDYWRSIYIDHGYDDRHTLYTAISMQEFYKENFFIPFLTSRVLQKDGDRYFFQYSFENETVKSAMEFNTWAERIVQDAMMMHDGFLYFLVRYSQESSDDQETRLVRICTRDGTFQSYSELIIGCDHLNSQNKTHGVAAYLDDSPSSDTKSIYVVFIREKGETKESALCIFPMTDVTRAFTTFPRDCIAAVGHSCQKEMKKDITDFCGSDVSPYTVSRPLVVPNFALIPNSTVTSITTVKNHNEIIVIVGDRSGYIQKISLTSGQIFSKNRLFEFPSRIPYGVKSPFVFDSTRQHLFVLNGRKIVKFPVASCRVHETCESCLTEGKIDPLNCGWCGGHCAHLEECENPGTFSRDTCTPSIFKVFPLKSPIQGDILMKITGDSLGTDSEGGSNLITVAGIACKVIDWQNREITCILGATPEEASGPVKLQVFSNSSSIGYNIEGSATSHLNFSYYAGPRLFGIQPNKGPTSGGTHVSLFGDNLDFENDKNRYIIVRGRLCSLREFNSTTAWCVTTKETNSDYPDRIAIVVGDTAYVMDKTPPPTYNHTNLSQSFEYLPDPEIHDIQPGITTVSGLLNATVTGLNLDSVQSPKIVVEVFLSQLTNLEFIEECWSDPESRGSKLTCSTPSIVDEPWLPSPVPSSPLLTHVSFIMDEVQRMREFSKHEEFMSRLLYYPDPEFKPFKEIQMIQDDKLSMEIEGNNLGLLHSVNNFRIRLGAEEFCKITTVSTELLMCDLSSNIQKTSVIGSNISVQVFMGSTSHQLGYITIIPTSQTKVVWEVILLAILVPVVVLGIAFLCFRKIIKKKHLSISIHDISLFNRTEASNGNPQVHQNDTSFDGPIQDPSEGILTLDREKMFILEELGFIIQKQHLIIGELIGSGQFGKVFKGSLQIPNKKEVEIAIKTLYQHLWTNPVKADHFMKEALTMKDFDHPHVLGLLGVCFEGNVRHIILPFMANGDLCKYIRDETKVLLITDLLKFAVDVASGMCYLAKLKFVHRDLAARNCVLDSSMQVKVADFGLSRDIYEANYYRSEDKNAQLPFRWTAPEVIETHKSTTQSDVWSYGVLLWELMTRGSIPYTNIGNWDVLPHIKLGHRLNQPQFCPKPLYHSMLACWNSDPKKRPSFLNLHSYVTELQNKLMTNTVTSSGPSALTIPVPAKNSIYYNSKELYLKMDGQDLNRADTIESYVVMKDLEGAYALINHDENIAADQTEC